MTNHLVEGIEILLWPHPLGFSAFAAPWGFDLEYDAEGKGTVDASFGPLNVADYASRVDRYRVLDGSARATILKAALARRDDDKGLLPSAWEHCLVRHHEPGIDEAAFLEIAARFIHAWRQKNGVE